MDIRFRDELSRSKCNSCSHAFIAETFYREQPVTMCKLLGMYIQPIKKCNHYLPFTEAPLPSSMVQHGFLIIDPANHSGTKTGFGSSKKKKVEVEDAERSVDQLAESTVLETV